MRLLILTVLSLREKDHVKILSSEIEGIVSFPDNLSGPPCMTVNLVYQHKWKGMKVKTEFELKDK